MNWVWGGFDGWSFGSGGEVLGLGLKLGWVVCTFGCGRDLWFDGWVCCLGF